MDVVTTKEAAKRLGVSDVAVRKMLKSGRLTDMGMVGHTILIDPASLHRALESGKRSGRLWTPKTAWAALCLLSGDKAPWIESTSRYRLTRRLRDLSPGEVQQLARNRAGVKRYRATPTAVDALQEALIPTAGAALRNNEIAHRFGLAGGGGFFDGYAAPGDGSKIAAALGMVDDPSGNVTIRETSLSEPFVEQTTPLAAIAVDLMDSLATRERSAGMRVLEELLNG